MIENIRMEKFNAENGRKCDNQSLVQKAQLDCNRHQLFQLSNSFHRIKSLPLACRSENITEFT